MAVMRMKNCFGLFILLSALFVSQFCFVFTVQGMKKGTSGVDKGKKLVKKKPKELTPEEVALGVLREKWGKKLLKEQEKTLLLEMLLKKREKNIKKPIITTGFDRTTTESTIIKSGLIGDEKQALLELLLEREKNSKLDANEAAVLLQLLLFEVEKFRPVMTKIGIKKTETKKGSTKKKKKVDTVKLETTVVLTEKDKIGLNVIKENFAIFFRVLEKTTGKKVIDQGLVDAAKENRLAVLNKISEVSSQSEEELKKMKEENERLAKELREKDPLYIAIKKFSTSLEALKTKLVDLAQKMGDVKDNLK